MAVTIAFHSNQIGLRGTEVAMYDYANYNETILGNKSIIISENPSLNQNSHTDAIAKFQSRFTVLFYDNFCEVDELLKPFGIDAIYFIKSGYNDGKLSKTYKNLIHVVFQNYDPHGDVYAYVSEWLSKKMTNGKSPFVPHIVDIKKVSYDLRKELNIPINAIVFGRYGGETTFDLSFAKIAVYWFALLNPKKIFLFLGTENFIEQRLYYRKVKWWTKLLFPIVFPKNQFKNIIFLPSTSDMAYKSAFINTSDAMLHAGIQGETFGLACGEFSIHNKPIITCNHPKCSALAHVQILGKKGVFYRNIIELWQILSTFEPQKNENFDAYSEKYNPETVMQQFKQVFLQ
jgi:hypothetical protein